MVSALDGDDQIAEALELGANDYITKPIDFTQALARIHTHLAWSRSAAMSTPKRREMEPEQRGEGLWDWNLESDRISYSPSWKTMLGLRAEALANEPGDWFSRVHPQDLGPLLAALRAHWRGVTEAFEMEYRVRCYDESYRWMVSRGAAFRNAAGKAIRMVGSQIDITDAKTLDPLTSLSNRLLFTEHVTTALESQYGESRGLAVLLIDIDRFYELSRSLGAPVGDALLIEFAKRIQSVVAKWSGAAKDRSKSEAARLSEHQFAVVLDGISSPLQAVSVADKMLQALRKEMILSSQTLRCTASIGVALSSSIFSGPHPSAEDILQNADAALCSARAQDEDCWVLFSQSMPEQSVA